MRFLIDECAGPAVAAWLRENNHEVFSIYEQARGMDDESIIRKALKEEWILITNDKDFGEKIFRDGRLHRGIILLRLANEHPEMKIRALSRLLSNLPELISDSFLVVTETRVRAARMP